jgi:hypothetical protein
MLTDRQNKRLELQRESEKMVAVLRAHWLKQVLNWPLKAGPLADRLTKAEVAALKKAAKQGKLFFGNGKVPAST